MKVELKNTLASSSILPTCPLALSTISFPANGPPTSTSNTAIADTGSTGNFFTVNTPVINVRPSVMPIAIRNPNGTVMYSTHDAELNLPSLPLSARQGHIVPSLTSQPLISIGQLCDAGCHVSFTATTVTVTYNNTVVLHGKRSPDTRLWLLDLPESAVPVAAPYSPESSNAAVASATPAELVAFAHATLFSPALSTLDQALQKNFLPNFPGLSRELLCKYLPHSVPMIKGHMDQSRKNQRTTKPKPTVQTVPADDMFPTSPPNGTRTHACFAAVMAPTGQVYTDQTGKFVAPSSNGNNYLCVLYDYDSNAILAEPMPSRTGKSILTAYKALHAKLCAAGLRPQLHRLDNECSAALKAFMVAENEDIQLVPPHSHRRNAAERAIRTFQNHFIAGLCSVDKDFPIHLWDRLLPQALLTLNLLRGSRLNPKLSAYAQLFGFFDFNRTPIAPPGIRVLAHAKPATRTTWSPHALDGWYTGPALDSYRCYKIWIWETRAERICDTVSWFPTKVTMPSASSVDMILNGIRDITNALQNPTPGSPLAPLTDSQTAALKTLMEVLHGVTAPGVATEPAPPTEPDVPDAAPLRVPTPAPPAQPVVPDAAPVRVPTPAPVSIVPDAASLRVPTPARIPNHTTAPPLRVPTTPDPDDVTIKTSNITYDATTGPTGHRRRRDARRRRQHATKRRSRKPKHSHGTRANVRAGTVDISPPVAASATEVTPPITGIPCPTHMALHGNAFNPDTNQLAEYAELSQCSEGKLWQQSNTDEIHRLAQGHGDVPGTNTIVFIPYSAIPKGRKPTYLRVVCAFRPEKSNPRRVRWTVGGDRIDYPGDVTTKTADLVTAKILFNSVLSTPNGRFMTGDLKDFYLGTPLDRYEYMRIPCAMLPDDIMDHYNLHQLVHNGYVYCEIRRGMYGLPQAGRIANEQLQRFLAPHGYRPVPITPGLWKHDTRDLAFSLVVDDFGVKYTSTSDAKHLMSVLRQHYTVSEEWDGARYVGLTLNWDYDARTCDISMPGYVERALQRFSHPPPTRPQDSPHAWQKPNYGAKTQYAATPDQTPVLDAANQKLVQEVIGVFLYYARAVDSTMLAALGTLATQQTKGTQATLRALTQFLNYAATHPDASVRFVASDMVLWADSDASYLSAPNARSRVAGYHFLSDRPIDPDKAPLPTDPPPTSNGAIDVLCQILRNVMSSAAEAELGGLFLNAKNACPIRITLEELGHPQPPTPIQTDNSTATGIANDSVKQKRSKAIDMRFYWVRDRVRQGQFHIYWRPGRFNKADYFTKHHPATHHRAVRSTYLHNDADPSRNYFACLQDQSSDPEDITAHANSEFAACSEGVLISGNPDISSTAVSSP